METFLTDGGVTTIKELVFDFFRLCELEPLEIRKGIWQVAVDEALIKELDGWRAQARLLQFTFDQQLAETYGADLICPGSYRLNSILQVIRKQGLYSNAHIPHHFFHEPNIRRKIVNSQEAQRVYVVNSSLHYGQYLELQIAVTTHGLQKKERVHTPLVNLSSGEVLKYAIPPHLLRSGGVPAELVRKRKVSFKRAFQAALDYLNELQEQNATTWTQEALEKLHQEEKKLEGYFDGRVASPEYSLKKEELHKRFWPTVRMDALRGAIIFVPLFGYRLVLVDANGNEKTQTLFYDPISSLEELN